MITEVSEEILDFLNGIDQEESEKTLNYLFNSSTYLKRIKAYAEIRGIEFMVFMSWPNFLLTEEEKRTTNKLKFPTVCFFLAFLSPSGETKKIIFLPSSFIILRKEKPGFLKWVVLTCLHEIAHAVHLEETQPWSQDREAKIIDCRFGKTSCLGEEIETGEEISRISKELKIRITKRELLRHWLAGITAHTLHDGCFWALRARRCLIQEKIEQSSFYRKYLKPPIVK